MSILRPACSLAALLLWGSVVPVAAGPGRRVASAVDVRACPIGHPVTLSLQLVPQAGEFLRWHLADAALTGAALVRLPAGEGGDDGAVGSYRIVFTMTRAGRYRWGPFPVLVYRGSRLVDTVYAPAVALRFAPEPLRAGLHPIKPPLSVREAVSAAQQAALGLAGLLLLLVAAGTSWAMMRRPAAAVPAAPDLTPDQARQLALARIGALESWQTDGQAGHGQVDEELLGIVREYLARAPDRSSAGEVPAALAEFDNARFSPTQGDRDRLLALARQVVLGTEEPEPIEG